jgi:hypothetical protein
MGASFSATNPPAYNSFSNINFGSTCTLVADGDGLLMTSVGAATTNLIAFGAVNAIPDEGAYSLTVGLDDVFVGPPAYAGGGICVTDGTVAGSAKCIVFSAESRAINQYGLATKITYLNYFSSGCTATDLYIGTITPNMVSSPVFLRIRDDRSATLFFELSKDLRVWQTMWSYGRTTKLTPAYAGLCQYQGTANVAATLTRCQMKIFHWTLA